MYMCSAICVLHLAEPELGVKAIVRRLGPQHPRIATGDTRTVRDVLQHNGVGGGGLLKCVSHTQRIPPNLDVLYR